MGAETRVLDYGLQPTIHADVRWQLVERVASSRAFARSLRLQQFLRYVCERAIDGRTSEINEQQIGVHVFGRASDYNSGEDNIVRAHARLLRKKLEEYFETEGAEEPVRILIPKGGYSPAFEPRLIPEPAPGPASVPTEVAQPDAGRRRRTWQIAAILGVTAVAALVFALASRGPQATTSADLFWKLIFNPNRPTYLILSDTALVIYQRLAGKELSLAEYINRQFDPVAGFKSASDPQFPDSVTRSRYTNMPDTDFCWRLARNPAINLGRTTLRYARELRIGDLKGSNAVLIGARRANPWVELFNGKLNFQALFDAKLGRDYILNRKPLAGEQPTYIEHSADGQKWSYSFVAFVEGLNQQGHALLVGGTTTAGTEGAIDFVLNEPAFTEFLKKTAERRPGLPHFEVLLRTGNIAGNARQTEILSVRVHE